MTTDLIDRYMRWLAPRARPATLSRRKRLLIHMDRHLPEGIARANEAEVADYLAAYAEPWTRYTYDTHARDFYRHAAAAGWITFDPMAELPKPDPGDFLPHPCEDDELALALTAPPPYGRAILLASRVGLRCGEIARARRRHLLRGDRLHIVGKGGRIRIVPVDETVLAAIADEPDWLLGEGVPAARVAARDEVERRCEWLTSHQRRVWRRLGLPDDFRLHSGRHWFATRLLESGATLREVQTALGHASPMTTAGYTQVTDGRLAAAVRRLPLVGATSPSLAGSSLV